MILEQEITWNESKVNAGNVRGSAQALRFFESGRFAPYRKIRKFFLLFARKLCCMINVQFWGAAQTVTGSMHLVEFAGYRILLDCGIYQGKRKEAFEQNRVFPFQPSSIDLVILSHAHIDHSGNLPSLVRSGFRGPIYCTSATRDLCGILLVDSAKIQESDVKYVNKKRAADGKKPFEPLYVLQDAIDTLKRFRTVEFDSPFQPLDGLQVVFHTAGHMLGAAIVELRIKDGENTKKPFRLVFSGDLGRPQMPILKDPATELSADFLILEATYGDRLHDRDLDTDQRLLEAVDRTINEGGRLIIPAFSVGRTQEIVYRLNRLHKEKLLPAIQVFVDSPMAVNATEIYRSHVDCYDEETREMMLDDDEPLNFSGLKYVRKTEESMAINRFRDPCVIISASGMLEGGRVLHHLKHAIEKSNTTIMFAGYQAPRTLGRYLLDHEREEVKIFGQPFKVAARIERLEGCSGHADQKNLMEWTNQIAQQGGLAGVALVHCELEPATVLKEKLNSIGIAEVSIPSRGSKIELKKG